MNNENYAQPFIKPYWEDTESITREMVKRYLIAKKGKSMDEIIFGYMTLDDERGIIVYSDTDTAPLDAMPFDYWRIEAVFQHAHYIQKELDISGVRVVTGAGGCGMDDHVYYLYTHQNISFNPRGHFIMVPKTEVERATRQLRSERHKYPEEL